MMDWSPLIIVDVLFHLDRYVGLWSTSLGVWFYLILFLIIFMETGLIVTPFLPGDSLLFAVGAVCAQQDGLDLGTVIVLLIIAAIVGDAVNFSIGRRVGRAAYDSKRRWLNRRYFDYTQSFYDKHGGKAIIIARFAPILRTFAPFVAGVGRMDYKRFAFFNVSGAIVWVVSFTVGGYAFGNAPIIKDRFHLVVLAVIIVSLLPTFLRALRKWQRARRGEVAAPQESPVVP